MGKKRPFRLIFTLLLFVPACLAYGGFGNYPQFGIPLAVPESPYYHQSNPYGELQSRQIRIPPMRRVSETLGALGTVGRYLLRRSRPDGEIPPPPRYTPYEESEEESSEVLYTSSSQNQNQKVKMPELTVKPEDDSELGKALYTLGRNVLGQNMTDTLVPVVQSMNSIGKFLPPLVYRDGRIIIGDSANSTKDGGPIRDVICTTPGGTSGKCLDLSGCPSLLFDLSNLRKSLCFKALFVPGVCCPDRTETIKKPQIINNVQTTTNRPRDPIINLETTRRPPLFEIPSSKNFECGRAEKPSFRIVGGEKSVPGMWPWMAAIFLHGPKGTEFWCGGSLISKRYILTAAHCTKDQKQKSFSPRQFTVRLGDYDLVRTDDNSNPETYRVVEIIAHPDFSGMGFYNDVALLKLDSDVNFSRYISPVCLPQGRSRSNDFTGTTPTVIGWGTNRYGGREHNALQEVKLPVWTNSQCDRAYFQPITDIFLCAGLQEGGKDACQGDSGGPLMLELEDEKWTQIGIVSFGNRCAEPGYPGVYTRITKFLDWIQDKAKL